MIPYNKKLVVPARELRTHPTKAEKCLWQRLQLKHLDFKFYRQKPLGNYIVDFFCPKAHLVIEVDGGHHFIKAGKENDRLRDEYMKSLELTVLRVSNSDVINSTDNVVENISKILLSPSLKRGTIQKKINRNPLSKMHRPPLSKEEQRRI
jgi:very-short-patch-repair endonuclease